MVVPGRVLFHSTCMNPWVMPQGGARGQNLGHPNKVVFCSLFIQTTSYYTNGIWSMQKGYIRSVCLFICLSFCPSVCPDVILSVNPFYNQVLLRSVLITYNSAATDQKLFIFGMGVPEWVLFHSTSINPWVMPQGRARGQNLGHLNKVVYCSLYKQPLIKEGWASDLFITSTFSVIRSRSLWPYFHASVILMYILKPL